MALWNRFFGSAVSTAAGVSVGGAIQGTLDPLVRELMNTTWSLYQHMPVDPYFLALGVAQGQIGHDTAATIATHWGISGANFQHMVDIANVGPGAAFAFELWRRLDDFSDADFKRALKRMGLEAEWIDDLARIKNVLLTPTQIANAVQQGHMPNDGLLPQIDPTIPFPSGYQQPPAPDDAGPSHVPLTQIDLDPVKEAEGSGVTRERLQIEANLAGLPPGPHDVLAMWNRNLIDESTVDAGIREGHMKTKWAHAFKRMRWAVLSAQDYAELWLRGWITQAQAHRGGALTGHTPEQVDYLYQNRGRPLSPTQALTALVRKLPSPRGAGYPTHAGPFDENDFELAIRRSNIRTEYVPVLRQALYLYPALFQLNRLVTAGAIDAATARDWAMRDRYHPDVVTTLHTYWLTLEGATATDSRVKSAETSVVTQIRNAFVQNRTDEAAARGWLGELDIAAAAQDDLIRVWNIQKQVPGAGLTRAQVKKAFQNLPTEWPRDRALGELEIMGMEPEEAQTYLDE